MMDIKLDIVRSLSFPFSFKAFFIGLAAVAAFYVLLFLFLALNADKTLQAQEANLASTTALIIRTEDLPKPYKPPPGQQTRKTPPPDYAAPKSNYDLEKMKSGLAVAPVTGLHKKTLDGKMPLIRKDGLTAFEAYRRPFNGALLEGPMISIAVMDLGLSSKMTQMAMDKLPEDVSFIFSPYTDNMNFWIMQAREKGHEVWLTLPMETASYPYTDPGPHTLLISGTERENLKKLDWLLSQGVGSVGFVNVREPSFMRSYNDMRPVIAKIYEQGLGFVDSSENPEFIPQSIAHGMNAPYAVIDLWLDNDPDPIAVQEKLDEFGKLAQDQGWAAGIIRAHPSSFMIISDWLQKTNLTLAPLSAQTGM